MIPPSDEDFEAQINAMGGAITAELLLRTAVQYLTQSEHTTILIQGSDLTQLVQICRDMLEVTDRLNQDQKSQPEGILEALATDVAGYEAWVTRTDQQDGRLSETAERIGDRARALFMWCDGNLPHPPPQRLPLNGPNLLFLRKPAVDALAPCQGRGRVPAYDEAHVD